nr:hypothetical protein BaRGS_029474 [Batillaria attramentaria]
MTGEKALADGCGKKGRPYKYRGESHVQALRQVLKDVREEVWLVGFTPSLPEYSIIRIPGNNVFLCALECHNSRFVMLQEVQEQMEEAQGYWVALSRQNVSLWLDDSATVSALIAVLVLLSFLSVVLVVCLCNRSSPTSRSVEYTEVCVSDVNHDSPDQEEEEQKHQDDLDKRRSRAAALRAESKDTVAGSEDTTYSVLSYRRAIQRAWVGLKRTAAYAHVIVRRPKKGDEADDTSHALNKAVLI